MVQRDPVQDHFHSAYKLGKNLASKLQGWNHKISLEVLENFDKLLNNTLDHFSKNLGGNPAKLEKAGAYTAFVADLLMRVTGKNYSNEELKGEILRYRTLIRNLPKVDETNERDYKTLERFCNQISVTLFKHLFNKYFFGEKPDRYIYEQ